MRLIDKHWRLNPCIAIPCYRKRLIVVWFTWAPASIYLSFIWSGTELDCHSSDVDKLIKLLLHNPFVLTLTEVGRAKDDVIPKNVQQFWASLFCCHLIWHLWTCYPFPYYYCKFATGIFWKLLRGNKEFPYLISFHFPIYSLSGPFLDCERFSYLQLFGWIYLAFCALISASQSLCFILFYPDLMRCQG